jgi:hypothetical protein
MLSVDCFSGYNGSSSIPSRTTLLLGRSKLDLDPVDAVDTVNEQDEDEDKCDLQYVSARRFSTSAYFHTFMPYCSLATRGLLEMNSKSPRFTLKGIGTIRETKRSISKTRSPKTWMGDSQLDVQLLPTAVSADRCVDQTHGD